MRYRGMKNLLMLSALACLAFLYCRTADAANWVQLGTSDDESATLYVDKESIAGASQNVVRARTKFLFEKPEAFESKPFSQMLVYVEYDCSTKRSRMLELTFDYADGSQETFSLEKEWAPVKAGTLQDESYLYLCR